MNNEPALPNGNNGGSLLLWLALNFITFSLQFAGISMLTLVVSTVGPEVLRSSPGKGMNYLPTLIGFPCGLLLSLISPLCRRTGVWIFLPPLILLIGDILGSSTSLPERLYTMFLGDNPIGQFFFTFPALSAAAYSLGALVEPRLERRRIAT